MKTKINLNYRVIGEGYPVVFLHGFLENNSMWDSLIPKLKGIKAILIELPGHGDSPFYPYGEEITIRNMSEDVNDVLKSLFLDKLSIVGHSLGGYVALDLKSIDKSNTIEKLVLLNSHPWSDSENKKKERTRVSKVVKRNKMLFLKEAIPQLFRDTIKYQKEIREQLEEANEISEIGIIQSLQAMRDRKNTLNVMDELGEMCLVIQGKYDHLIPHRDMEELVEQFGNEYYLVENAGHMAHIESTNEVTYQLQNFIQP